MAQTMFCNGCDTAPAALLIQVIGTPEVMAFCPPCSLTWAEGHVAFMRDALGIGGPGEPETAADGDLEAGKDTPENVPDPDPGTDGSGLPQGVPGDEITAEGGVTDGQLREHDSGPDAGDRPAADRSRPDDGGADRQGRSGGGGTGREGERERRRNARSGVAPDTGT